MLITCPKCSAKYKIPPEIKIFNGKKMQCSACEHIFEFSSKPKEQLSQTATIQPPPDAVLSFDANVKRIVVKTAPASSSDSRPVLPEVFRPVQLKNPPKKSLPYFWIVVCFVLVIGLIGMGWLWRDLWMLKNQSFPLTSPPVSVRLHKMPSVKPVAPTPVVLPVFVAEEAPVAEAPVVLPKLSVQSVRFRKTPTGEAVLIEGVLKNTTSEKLPVPEKIYALAYDTKGALAFEKEIYLPAGILYPDMEQPFFGTYTPALGDIQWVDVVLEK
ncbi:MAG: zinc-ribbon domain-containing protein [Alphaproteobacteria bacterium]